MVRTIAIIGVTEMSSELAKALAKGPYRLLLFEHDTEKLVSVKSSILNQHPEAEIEAVTCPVDASWEADIIIPAVPYEAEKELAKAIKAVATQKIVIHLSNPLKSSSNGCETASDNSAAEDLQTLLPHSKVVKIFAADFTKPVVNNQPTDCFITGNDKEAIEIVKEIINTAGFNAVISNNYLLTK